MYCSQYIALDSKCLKGQTSNRENSKKKKEYIIAAQNVHIAFKYLSPIN